MTEANETRNSTRKRVTKRFHDDKLSLSKSTDMGKHISCMILVLSPF